MSELDKLRASNSVMMHLILALYDAIDNKELIIKQFSDVTRRTSIETLYSDMSDEFYDEFEFQRSLFLDLLNDAKGKP